MKKPKMTTIKMLLLISCLSLISHHSISQTKTEVIASTRESVVWIHSFSMPYVFDKAGYSTGTGYVASNDGLIITNNHVVEGSNGLLVYSSNNEEPYFATIIYKDSILDLAVIKASNCFIKPLEFENPENILQGDEILIFGYPGAGYKNETLKVSWGIVSSSTEDSTLQTTASINPGNSGGPAVNMAGKVVGTVYAKIVGLNIEGTGFIRNVEYSTEAIATAQEILSQQPLKYYGTSSFEAYKNICEAAVLGWKAEKTTDLILKGRLLDTSKEKILAAIDDDPGYGEAYYFLAAFYFNKYLTNCFEGSDSEARLARDNFIKAYEDAELKKPSLSFRDNFINSMEKDIKNKTIECSHLRSYILNKDKMEKNQEERWQDFLNYIVNGENPKLLARTLGSRPETAKPPKKKSTLLQIGEFEVYNPVRFSISFPDNYEIYHENIGVSFGNAGHPGSDHIASFKHQMTLDLFQNKSESIDSMSYTSINRGILVLSDQMGVQFKFLKRSRINPKPYFTIGWNPVNVHSNSSFYGKTDQWYWNNGSFNYGIDVDVWLSSSFGLSFSYEQTSFFSNHFSTLYGNGPEVLYLKYSKVKVGLIF